MRKGKTKPFKSGKKFIQSYSKPRQSSKVKVINVQLATYRELDEEWDILDVERTKLHKKYHKAREDALDDKKRTFDSLWNQFIDADSMDKEDWDEKWKELNKKVGDEYDAKDDAIVKEYDNKFGVLRDKMMPLQDAIMERFIKPDLRRDVERHEPIPLTAFREMIDGGSFGVVVDLRDEQKLVSDLDNDQLSTLRNQTRLGDLMENFINNHGYTSKDEERYGKYLDWSYESQYNTLGGAGIDPEMDFWLHINQSARELENQRAGKKVVEALGSMLDTLIDQDDDK